MFILFKYINWNIMNREEEEISYATNKRNIKKQKVVFIGEQYVGKTSIITRFIKDTFDASHNSTIGIDFVSKNVSMDGRPMRLQLWDTAGQQRFRSLIPSYLRDCQAAFIVFDLTNEETFNFVTKWLDFVKEHRGQDALIFVIGNKLDLKQERVVDHDVAYEKFKELGVQYLQVSAKTGQNIQLMFQAACARLLGLTPQQVGPLEKQKPIPIENDAQLEEKKVTKKVIPKVEEKGEKGRKLSVKDEPHRIKEKNCC